VSPLELSALTAALVVFARVLPAVVLCPWLGAAGTPVMVRMGLSVVLAGWGAWTIPGCVPSEAWVPALVLEQIWVGTLLGGASALGCHAALAAGRWSDLFRGASAEALNPGTGSRESAGGELLSRLIVTAMAAGSGLGLTVTVLLRSFLAVPPGSFQWTETALANWLRLSGELLGAGVSLAAPVAAVTLVIDFAFAGVARVAPSLSSVELQAPARLLCGLAVFALVATDGAARLGTIALNGMVSLAEGGLRP
jgi:flagellar biosynthesis protein FliR